MTRYRTQSANVLNEADQFSQILDWELFTADQDALLWGGNETEWKPGTPLVTHPHERIDDLGGHPRPIFELMSDVVFHNRDQIWFLTMCEKCQVSWEVGSSCWMCGDVTTKPLSYKSINFSFYE